MQRMQKIDIWGREVTYTRGAGRLIIGGGGPIFIYSCSQTVKTIDFKI